MVVVVVVVVTLQIIEMIPVKKENHPYNSNTYWNPNIYNSNRSGNNNNNNQSIEINPNRSKQEFVT